MTHMIDFDSIDDWAPQLAEVLKNYVPASVKAALVAATPRYVEDARDLLFRLADRDVIVDATLAWIRSSSIAGYHGTRLTDDEVISAQTAGLLPLKAVARRGQSPVATPPLARGGR
jgi:hypothetical protein